MSLGLVLAFGLLLGMRHATEPDHLAAVASLASRERSLRAGMFHGMAWGIGHTLVLLIVAGALGFLGWVISPLMAGYMERVVGAMLILLGIGVARRLRRADGREGGSRPQRLGAHAHSHKLPGRSVVVGMVHGLAGSAALALLASQSMSSRAWMLVYIAVFGLGSILGMVLLSGMMAIPLGLATRRLTGVSRVLVGSVALFSIAMGGRLLFAVSGS
jgi:hypothetical protein